jgi:hypothetical protein
MNTLTIITVSYCHKALIEFNIEFVKQMNPDAEAKWIIVENTPKDENDRLEIGDFKEGIVVEGVPNTFMGVAAASYHHASGLNTALKKVETKYALILDPDFFIVRKNWINDVLVHMKINSLTFFGAPYNPKRYMKYRYFPCIHCMFIDLSKIDKGKIDFTPQYKQQNNSGNKKIITSHAKNNLVISFLENIKHHLRILLKRKSIIGSSMDTGYKIFNDFYNLAAIKNECLQPVFGKNLPQIKPMYLKWSTNLLVEKCLPENFCYIPKKIGYYAKKDFSKMGFWGVLERGWDEFVWKSTPFGFHMQGANKNGTTDNHINVLPDLNEILKYYSNLNK